MRRMLVFLVFIVVILVILTSFAVFELSLKNEHKSSFLTQTQQVGKSLSVVATASQYIVDPDQTFNLRAIVTGGTPPYLYTWHLNVSKSLIIGTGATVSYSLSVPQGPYHFYVEVFDHAGHFVSSNTITMIVDPPIVISISSSKNPIIYGESVTFTANVTGGSGTYLYYQWYVNGIAISNATSKTLTTSNLPIGNDSITLSVIDSNNYTTSPQWFVFIETVQQGGS